MTEIYGNKNLLITPQKRQELTLVFWSMGLSEPFEDPESSIPACFPLLPGLVTISAGGSCRGFWSMHTQSFEF